jgi:hypothetical protein
MERRSATSGEGQGQFLEDAPISPSAQAQNNKVSDASDAFAAPLG